MTGWIAIALLAAAVLLALWLFARLDRALLQLVAATLFLGMAGYAWQGRPGLASQPAPPPARSALPPTEFAAARKDLLGQFDTASRWLIIAEHYQRSGDTRSGAEVIRSALRQHPRNADLWVALGDALVLHADGVITPAAELAFRRAEALAPDHPAPPFFHGLALAQNGRLDEAEALWRGMLGRLPAGGPWRQMIERRLALIDEARRIIARRQTGPEVRQP